MTIDWKDRKKRREREKARVDTSPYYVRVKNAVVSPSSAGLATPRYQSGRSKFESQIHRNYSNAD